MYLETTLPELKEAYKYWREVTLKMAYHEEGLAGYKFYHGSEEEWKNDYSVLGGIAGVGLSLLSPVNPDWDEILLLSFK
jgi:hypothetical protein